MFPSKAALYGLTPLPTWILLGQRIAMCDLWVGFGEPLLRNWGCSAGSAPVQPICQWQDITCDSCGNILMLSSVNNDLVGTISSSLANLTALTNLNLHNNLLTNKLPTELGQLTALHYVAFYSNRLTGTIPTEYGQLTGLTYIDFSFNKLTGKIPGELGNLTALKALGFYTGFCVRFVVILPWIWNGLPSLWDFGLDSVGHTLEMLFLAFVMCMLYNF